MIDLSCFLAPSELYKSWCLSDGRMVGSHYAFYQLMKLIEVRKLMYWSNDANGDDDEEDDDNNGDDD